MAKGGGTRNKYIHRGKLEIQAKKEGIKRTMRHSRENRVTEKIKYRIKGGFMMISMELHIKRSNKLIKEYIVMEMF